ncbi:MAG: hypothetical protein ACI867_000145 [Glaciecola sp.]|jgi:hypothetical protein
MAGPCSADFERLAQEMGDFGCQGANAVLNLHNPFGLDHWTMPIIEFAMLIGAGLALRHALRRRRAGDPTALAIWLAAIAYLVIVEPPLYFPAQFGLQEQVGLIFVHNEFSVQFLWQRLPLYIISAYPVMAMLAYELVRVTGVFQRRGAVVSALTVGFVYHLFYEIFDHVGPQLFWWIWNPSAPTNEPMLASVPISSMVNFAVAGPVALTFLIRVLIANRPDAATMSTKTLVLRSTAAGFLMPLGLVLGGLPVSLLALGDTTNHTAQAVVYWTMLAITGVVAVIALAQAQRDERAGLGTDIDQVDRRYLLTHAAIYLGALVVAWGAAMPEYFGAIDGITASGTPVGSLPYAAVCFVGALGIVALIGAKRPAPAEPKPEADEVADLAMAADQ